MWTKKRGHGRAFYSSLGHHDDIFEISAAIETMRRGFLWNAEGKDIAVHNDLDSKCFEILQIGDG